MTFQITIKPISKWIGTETKQPGNSQFKQTYSNTKKILEFELAKLGAIASSVQLEMFIHADDDVRRDGELRANCKPLKPGVVLSFSKVKRRFLDESSKQWKKEMQTLSYPCDSYNDWKDNLRAVALSLEALRKVARYGVFRYEDMIARLALPSADGKLSDINQSILFLSSYTSYIVDELLDNPNAQKQAYRAAAIFLHPDQNGGEILEDFHKLQDAKRILGL